MLDSIVRLYSSATWSSRMAELFYRPINNEGEVVLCHQQQLVLSGLFNYFLGHLNKSIVMSHFCFNL